MENIENTYDKDEFYLEYKKMRDTKLNANELLEIPVMKSLLDNLSNKSIIDLGCGNGCMSRYFIESGAKKVLGLDISNNMLNEAKEINALDNITYQNLPLENLDAIDQKFDIAYSSLAFHYIEDFEKLIKDIYNLLNDDGILLFSQEHPLVTAPIINPELGKYLTKDDKRYYYLSDYNNISKRDKLWNDTIVKKYHRNFSITINTLIKQGFEILEIQESQPNKKAIELIEKYKYQIDRPYFLFIKAIKK